MLAAAARIKPFKAPAAARCLSSHGPTHEVLNQQTPLAGGYNLFSGDKALAESVTRWGGDWHKEGFVAHGAKMGCAEYMKHGDLANRNPPVLKTHDANGRRVDTVEFHPSYHALMKAHNATPSYYLTVCKQAHYDDTRGGLRGGWRNGTSGRTSGWRNWQDRRCQISFHDVFQKEPASFAVKNRT